MASSLVKAKWVGPFDAEPAPGVRLEHGDEYEVTKDDLLSSHWEPVGTEAKKAEKAATEDFNASAEAGS
jgi:hypothetical protein